jgi:tripeptide aminopeptidase
MRFFRFSALALILAAVAAHAYDLKPALRDTRVKAALAHADASRDALVEEWVRLTEISAPSGHETERAEYMMERFRALGLADVRRDAAGNVVGVLKGTAPSEKFIVFDAHLDTVVKPGVEVKVRRENGRLHAGGVGDDTSGLIGLLYMLEAVQKSGLRFRQDIVFTASVEEEIGLVGATKFVEENAARIDKFVSVDGGLGSVSYGATCIYWYKFHFLSDGAHTLSSYGRPSATHAAARAIGDLYALPLEREPEERRTWLNVGMLGGGDVPNAQSRDAWFSVDLRSNSPAVIAGMEKKILAVGAHAAEVVGVRFESETIQKMEGAQIPGHAESDFVKAALAALEAAGVENPKASMLGSSNHNAALLRGIPGINIGVTKGEGAHTPTEWAEIEPVTKGVKQLILLAAALAGVGK